MTGLIITCKYCYHSRFSKANSPQFSYCTFSPRDVEVVQWPKLWSQLRLCNLWPRPQAFGLGLEL